MAKKTLSFAQPPMRFLDEQTAAMERGERGDAWSALRPRGGWAPDEQEGADRARTGVSLGVFGGVDQS